MSPDKETGITKENKRNLPQILFWSFSAPLGLKTTVREVSPWFTELYSHHKCLLKASCQKISRCRVMKYFPGKIKTIHWWNGDEAKNKRIIYIRLDQETIRVHQTICRRSSEWTMVRDGDLSVQEEWWRHSVSAWSPARIHQNSLTWSDSQHTHTHTHTRTVQ